MRLYFKDVESSFTLVSEDIRSNIQQLGKVNPEKKYVVGVDGSTTGFGLAYWNEETPLDPKTIVFSRSTESNPKEFLDNVFPFLAELFRGVTLETVTYERTPDDFEQDTHAHRVMKNTEKSIKQFFSNRFYTTVSSMTNVFDIFPNSWRAYIIPQDLENNPGKKNKLVNATETLKHIGIEPTSFLAGYPIASFDSIEALAIGRYGHFFIRQGPFLRTYRNFTRRRPLYLLGRLVREADLVKAIKYLRRFTNNACGVMYIPNQYQTHYQNLFALDSDDKLGYLIVSPDDHCKPYLEHLLRIDDEKKDQILLCMTLRVNDETEKLVQQEQMFRTSII